MGAQLGQCLSELSDSIEQVKSLTSSLDQIGATERVNAIVMDLTDPLPELAAFIEELSDMRTIIPPMILLGEPKHREAVLEALGAGAFDFLSKPPSEDELCALVKEATLFSENSEEQLAKLKSLLPDDPDQELAPVAILQALAETI